MKNDWIKIKNYYIHHSISLEDLAKKYKVSASSVNKRCRKEGWVKLKEEKQQEIDKKVSEKIEKSEVDRKAKTNELHNELYNKGLEVANMLLDEYIKDLKEGKKKTKANAYNLDFIMKAIANAQKGQRLSLNIDKEEQTEEKEITIVEGLDIRKI
jgi:DNA-binding MurR/RpiR family transcriptional regulator